MARFIRSMPRGSILRSTPGSAAVATLGVTVGLLVLALWSWSDGVAPTHGRKDTQDEIRSRAPDPTPVLGVAAAPPNEEQHGDAPANLQPLVVPVSGTTDRASGQTSLTFRTLSVSADHACGVLPSGSIACWGRNFDNQATPPAGSFKSVTAGRFHSCGIHLDDTVTCWGRDVDVAGTPENETFRSVDAGEGTCGITDTGSIKCWEEGGTAYTLQSDNSPFQQVSVGH